MSNTSSPFAKYGNPIGATLTFQQYLDQITAKVDSGTASIDAAVASAAQSASTASTAATGATASATSATGSANTASTAASNASASQTAAASSASAAATSASNASSSQTAAATSATNAAASAATAQTAVATVQGNANVAFRNRVHNGGFVIAQRFGYGSRTPTASENTCDRWKLTLGSASRITTEIVNAPTTAWTGATKILQLTSTGAYTAGAAEAFHLSHVFEGFDVADLHLGLLEYHLGLSFWAFSNQGGNYSVALRRAGGARTCVQTFALSANATRLVKLNFTTPTAGTFNKDNQAALELVFDLGSGTDHQTAVTGWQASSATRATGSASLLRTGEMLRLGNIQLEKMGGPDQHTWFEGRPMGVETQICRRYLQRYTGAYSAHAAAAAQNLFWMIPLPAAMRAAPTVTIGATGGGNFSAAALSTATTEAVTVQTTATAAGAVNYNADLTISAEL